MATPITNSAPTNLKVSGRMTVGVFPFEGCQADYSAPLNPNHPGYNGPGSTYAGFGEVPLQMPCKPSSKTLDMPLPSGMCTSDVTCSEKCAKLDCVQPACCSKAHLPSLGTV